MKLDEAQKAKVTAWIAEGLKLSEIQNRIVSELGLRVTYMDVRFLVDDLKLVPKDIEPPKAATPAVADLSPALAAAPMPEGISSLSGQPPAPAGASVSVTVDQLARSGAMVSGKVTFSDGNTAEWYFDQQGRLGLAPKQTGYRPAAADLQQFQSLLEAELSRQGL